VSGIFQSEVGQGSFLWTRGIAASEVLRYLDKNAIAAEPLLLRAQLSRGQLSDNSSGISFAVQNQFLELAAIETNDPLLGLHVAAEMDVREAGILFYLAASSATVADAIEDLVRYAGATSEAVRFEISRRKDETVLTGRPVLVDGGPWRQFSEFSALTLIRILRRLTNRDFTPRRITFTHTRDPRCLREIHRILRCPVEFAQTTDSWVLSQSVMQLPITSRDNHLLQILQAHAKDLVSERYSATGWRGMVENQLVGMLSSGRIKTAAVARQLGLSTRSFTRHLAEEGTSFGEILERVRHRMALRYLEDRAISLQQIAWLLGYSEVGAFNHAFKRWTGTSPGRARKSAAILGSASARS
jgi:AraC-like DNA-binding protein